MATDNKKINVEGLFNALKQFAKSIANSFEKAGANITSSTCRINPDGPGLEVLIVSMKEGSSTPRIIVISFFGDFTKNHCSMNFRFGFDQTEKTKSFNPEKLNDQKVFDAMIHFFKDKEISLKEFVGKLDALLV